MPHHYYWNQQQQRHVYYDLERIEREREHNRIERQHHRLDEEERRLNAPPVYLNLQPRHIARSSEGFCQGQTRDGNPCPWHVAPGRRRYCNHHA